MEDHKKKKWKTTKNKNGRPQKKNGRPQKNEKMKTTSTKKSVLDSS